jgi:hypothetical protein
VVKNKRTREYIDDVNDQSLNKKFSSENIDALLDEGILPSVLHDVVPHDE